MARSALGSPSGRAGSPNGLTERVSCVFCSAPMIRTAPPQLRVRSAAPPAGAPRALCAGLCAFIRVLAKIRGFRRMRFSPAKACRKWLPYVQKITHESENPGHTTAEKAGGQMEKFSLETRIYAGAGAVSALETFGAKRLLLVTDPYFMKNGTEERIAGSENSVHTEKQLLPSHSAQSSSERSFTTL